MKKRPPALAVSFFLAAISFLVASAFASFLAWKILGLKLDPLSMVMLSVVILIALPAMLYLLLHLHSKVDGFPSMRLGFLLLSRCFGRMYRWLNCGWRSPVVRLLDVLVIIWATETIINFQAKTWEKGIILSGKLSNLTFSNGSLIHGTFSSNNSSFAAHFSSGAQLNGTLANGLLINGSLYNGTLINVNLVSENFFSGITSSILAVAWFQWEKILVIWFLLEVFRFAWTVSQQMVIGDFIDCTTSPKSDEAESDPEGKKSNSDGKDSKSDDKSQKPATDGLADLLIVNLNRIGELYRAVDEKRAIESECGAGEPIDASIKAEGTAEFLKNAVSSDSKLALGPVTIPTGSITSFVGRLIQGPRIMVSLHKAKNEKKEDIFFLTANLVGGKEPYSWLINDQKPLEEGSGQDKRSIEDMVTELSHRIFAKISFGESDKVVPWGAVWNFNEGLRAYRDCLHSTKQRKRFLKRAEKKFIEVLQEDDDFDLAYYNLGVVYSELKQPDAAETSFLKAIELNQNRFEAYYALGLNLFYRARDQEELHEIYGIDLKEIDCDLIIGQYEKVVQLCDQVIEIRNKSARAFRRDYSYLAKASNLKANARTRIGLLNGDFDEAIKSAEMAVDYSWLALFGAEIWGENVTSTTDIASECLIDLADLYLDVSKLNEDKYPKDWYQEAAKRLIDQALYIDPFDPNLKLELGKVYCCIGSFAKAISTFKSAVAIAPEDPKSWACLAMAYAESGNRKLALQACEKARHYGYGRSKEALLLASSAYDKLKERDRRDLLRRAIFLDELKADEMRGESSIPLLLEKLKFFSEMEGSYEWEIAEIYRLLIRSCPKLNDQDWMNHWKKIKKSIGLAEYDIDESNPDSRLRKKISLHNNSKGRDWEKAYDYYSLGLLLLEMEDKKAEDNFIESKRILKDKLAILREKQEKKKNTEYFLAGGRLYFESKDYDEAMECIRTETAKLKYFIDKFKQISKRFEDEIKGGLLNGRYYLEHKGQYPRNKNLELSKKGLDDVLKRFKPIIEEFKQISERFEDYMKDGLFIGRFYLEHKGPYPRDKNLELSRKRLDDALKQFKHEFEECGKSLKPLEIGCSSLKDKSDEEVERVLKESFYNLEKMRKVCEDECREWGRVWNCIEQNVLQDWQSKESKKDLLDTISLLDDEFKRCLRDHNGTEYALYVNEYARLLTELGQIYFESDKFKNMDPPKNAIECFQEAMKCFQEAIKLLSEDYPEEIKRSGLRSLLARSIKKQRRMYDALREAQKACSLNPLECRERLELGDIFCSLEEVDYGLDELDNASSWKPDDPDILAEMGRNYLIKAQEGFEKNQIKKDLEAALSYLEQALELYDKSQVMQRGKVRYWLGRVHMASGEYAKAIPHFRILHMVKYEQDKLDSREGAEGSPREESDKTKPDKAKPDKTKLDKTCMIATLQLGHAYLKLKAYDECEIVFDNIINSISGAETDTIVGSKLNDPMALGEVLAWAYLGKAFSYAERDGNISCAVSSKGSALRDGYFMGIIRPKGGIEIGDKSKALIFSRELAHDILLSCALHKQDIKDESAELRSLSDSGKAKLLIIWARYHISILDPKKTEEISKEELVRRKRRCLAACDDCLGWVLYKQDHIEEAIEVLHNSVSMSAKAISYLHLALTYERKLDKYDLGEKERSLEIRSALACCAHASVLDINKEFSSQINELQKRLGEEKPEESKKEKDEKESTLYTLKCELDGTAKGTLALKNPSDDKKKKD